VTPHEARFLKLDCSKASDLLGWRPSWTTSRAIAETVRWYRSFYHDGASRSAEATRVALTEYTSAARADSIAWSSAR
jgi:CDP-glucose 4,6-dehydratase